MLKRPFRLREDGTDLRVTISHIRGALERIGLDRSSHFRSIGDVSCCCHCCNQLPNAMLISLPMHCFHCKLTSLISQALLQTALEKGHTKGLSFNHEKLIQAKHRKTPSQWPKLDGYDLHLVHL
jgi:hypothetical protein